MQKGDELETGHLARAHFKIIGMYCTSCKPIIERQLKAERAITRIDIDYMTDSVIVDYDSQLISKEEIKKRLGRSGYKFSRIAM